MSWDDKMPMVLTVEEVRMLFTGAARYALPRGTLGSRAVARAVAAHAAELDEGTLSIVVGDVEHEVSRRDEMRADGAAYLPHPEPFEAMLPELRAALEAMRDE